MTGAVNFIGNVTNAGLGGTYPTSPTLSLGSGSICFFFTISASTGANQVIVSVDTVLHQVGFQILLDITSNTIAWLDRSSVIRITTITPTFGEWYFVALTFNVSSTATDVNMYIKPVGAPTSRAYSFISASTAGSFSYSTISVGNQHVFSGSSTSTLPLLGSVCGIKNWISKPIISTLGTTYILNQEEMERESEQIEPVKTTGLYSFFRLSGISDLRDATPFGLLLTAQSPTNIQQVSGPPIPDRRFYNDPSNLIQW